MNQEKIKYNIVRLRTTGNAARVIGSGVLYYESLLGCHIYLLTTAHCLFADGDAFKTPYESISIDYFNHLSGQYDTFIVQNLKQNCIMNTRKDEDLAVIRLPLDEFKSVTEKAAEIQLVHTNANIQRLTAYGFPKANAHETVLPTPATWMSWRLASDQFFLQMQSDMIEGYVQGYSGGALVLETETKDILLLGLFARFQMEDRGRVIYGQSLNGLNNLLSANRWQNVTFSYVGAGGIYKSSIEQHISKAIKNLGPNFNANLNVRTTTLDSIDSIKRNISFYKRLTNEINRWYNRDSFYSRENSAISELETEYSSICKNIVDKLKVLKFRIEEHIDLASAASDLLQFRERLVRKVSELEIKDKYESTSRYYNLIRSCDAYNAITENIDINLANNPVLVIEGEAGCGKSHLLGDIASSSMKAGKPVLLFLGSDFDGDKEIEVNMSRILGLSGSFYSLMESLNSYACMQNERVLILIDAINETIKKKLWKNNLAGFVEAMRDFPGIGLIITIRSTYLKETLPTEFLSDHSGINKITHEGLKGCEQEAIKRFCEYYEIAPPTLPLLNPEYTNPLLLHISCKVAQKTARKRFIMAHTGMGGLFKKYRDILDDEFDLKEDRDYFGRHVVSKAIRCIAEEMFVKNRFTLEYEECDNLLRRKIDNFPYLLRELIAEGVLTKEHGFDNDEQEFVSFTYQRLSDYYMAEYLVADCTDAEQVWIKFKDTRFKETLYENYNLSGIIEHLAIILPERFKIEFWELIDHNRCIYVNPGHIALESLKWRSAEHLDGEKFIDFINSQKIDEDIWLDTLIYLAPIPRHPFNADRWHKIMMKNKLPVRESFLQEFLAKHYNQESIESSIGRLIGWAWTPGVGKDVDPEVARLAAKVMGWFLCSTFNRLRDTSTKAMVNLLQYQTDALLMVMKDFRNVDDPYISERIYAVAYGCILRTPNVKDKQKIGRFIYNEIFKNATPPRHFLWRDYACCSVEYAVKEAGLKNVDMSIVLPPYNEPMPIFPDKAYVDSMKLDYNDKTIGHVQPHNKIIYSVVDGLADFGTKIVTPYVNHFHACSFKQEVEYQTYRKGLEKKDRELLDLYATAVGHIKSYKEMILRQKGDIKELQKAIDNHQLLFEKINPWLIQRHGQEMFDRLKDVLLPNHALYGKSRYEYGQDTWSIRNWIVKRVFELGYDKDLHGHYDEYVGYMESAYFRTATEDPGRIERIGKKYEWIALWEILACLADNYFIEDPWDSHKLGIYEGAWQSYWRNCDPACITQRSEDKTEPHWTEYNPFPFWEIEDTRWFNTFPELHALRQMLIRTDKSGNEWYTVNDYRMVREPARIGADRWGASNRYYNIDIRACLIRKRDKRNLISNTEGMNFWGMESLRPEKCGDYFIAREKYWSNGYKALEKYHKNTWKPLYADSPIKAKVLCEGMNGNIEGDYSGTRATYYMPTAELMQLLNCSYADEDGLFTDEKGSLVVRCNPDRTDHTLFRTDSLKRILDEKGWDIVWIVDMEKIGSGKRLYGGKMVVSSGLIYFDSKGSLAGRLIKKTPR